MAKEDKIEEKILDEVKKERESWALFKALNELGLNISEGFSPKDGIIGRSMKIKPVRIGMPGERDEGVVFGEPKRDTKYPIDSIKVINDKGQYYVEFLSSKAKGKPITYRKIDVGAAEEHPTFAEPGQKLLPPAKEQKLLPPYPEQKLLPPHPEQKLLPPYQEPKRLPPAKEQKLLPPHPEQKLLPPHKEQKLLPPHPEQKLLPPHPEQKLLPPASSLTLRIDSEPIKGVSVSVDGRKYATTQDISLKPGQHTVDAPRFVQKNGKNYFFLNWEDGSTDPVRIINLDRDMTIIAYYEQKEPEKIEKPKIEVIVDSAPMREVHVKVETKTKLPTPITDEKIADMLGIEKKRYTVKSVLEIAKEFVKKIEKGDFKNDDEALEYLKSELESRGITRYSEINIISNILLRSYFRVSEDWHTLDEWRNNALQSHISLPFMLRRPPQYLAIRNQDNMMTRRDQTRGDVFIGAGLDTQDLAKDVVDRNTYTVFYLTLLPGKYRFTADTESHDQKFERWEISRFNPGSNENPDEAEIYDILTTSDRGNRDDRYVRSMRAGVVTHWDNVLEIFIKEPVKLVAYYHKTADIAKAHEAEKRASGLNTYTRGGVTFGGTTYSGPRKAGDMAASMLGRSGVRNRIGWDVKTRELKKDPFLLAAINKGKRILNRYAKAEYSRIFNPRKANYKQRAAELKELKRKAMRARARLYKMTMRSSKSTGVGVFNKSDNDLINAATKLLGPDGKLRGDQLLQEARDWLENYLKARDSFYEDLKKDTEADAAQLRQYLNDKAISISIQLSRRYRMPVNSQDEEDLKEALVAYAGELTENFVARGRTFSHALMRGLGIASRGLETGGAAFTNIFYNFFSFLLGPWTITTLFTLVLFYFTFIFVGYNVTILWIMPLIGAAITFLLNFSDTFRPLDWVTHMASGAIIGYSAALLLISLGAPNWNFIGGYGSGFWIAWIVLGAIGLFQFYQTGGWKIVMQVGILILVFSYIALGPYHAYYDQAITQIKGPIEIAYKQVSNAVTDVWLLVTNPTEWYARQQLVNVRPERPLDYPKGVEFGSIEAMPPSVPQGQQFAMMSVIKNDGTMDANDVVISYSCNSWCDSRGVNKGSKEELDKMLATERGDKKIEEILDKETLDILRKGDGTSIYIQSELRRGESHVVTLSPLVASVFPQDRGLTNFAKVGINVSYAYSTNSTLQVDIISGSELRKRFSAGQTVFAPVLAVDKGTPARLSLNVGPQPLKEGTDQLLLVSVSNTRDKSRVVLPRGTNIIISLPNEVGTDLACGDQNTLAKEGETYYRNGYNTLVYKVEPSDPTQNSIEILPYEFNSIFAFLCSFKASGVGDGVAKSGFVTAEMPRYIFKVEQTKDVPITPRLGVLYDPFENVCKKITDPDKCVKNKDGDDACYWDSTLTAGDIVESVGSVATMPTSVVGITGKISKSSDCHSCGPVSSRSCDKFGHSNCGTASGSGACDIPCKWLSIDEMKKSGMTPTNKQVREEGMCGDTISGTGKCESITTGVCSVNNLKDKCSWNPDQASKICNVESAGGNPLAESGSDRCSDGNSFSAGLFQINVLSHGKSIEEKAGLAAGTCQNLFAMDCGGKIGDSQCCSKRNEKGACLEWKCHIKSDRLDDFNKCKNAVKDASTNIAIACQLYTANTNWNDWKYTRDKVCGDSLYKTTTTSDMTSSDASSWKINGQSGLAELGGFFDYKFYAQIKNIQNNEFTINLKVASEYGGYDDVDCKTGSGTDATLTEGSDVTCKTSQALSEDDIRFKLNTVDKSNKNIMVSVGPGPQYDDMTISLIFTDISLLPSENPLPDWTLCINNDCSQGKGTMVYANDKKLTAISLVNVGDNSAKFFAYTKTLQGWHVADCSDWQPKNGVTAKVGGDAEGCVPTTRNTESFKIQLNSIDQTNKKVYIFVSKIA